MRSLQKQSSKRILLARLFLFLLVFSLPLGSFTSCSSKPKKTYVIARDRSWYPVDLLGKEFEMSAFMDELILEIAETQGIDIQIIPSHSTINLVGLDQGKYDAKITSLTPSVITEGKYLFSRPLYLLGPVLVIRKNSSVKGLEDLEGKVLGIVGRAPGVFQLDQFPELTVTTYVNPLIALQDLEKNRIQGVIIDALVGYRYISTPVAEELTVITSPLTSLGFRLIARDSSEGKYLVEQFDEGLEKLRKEGVYLRLLEKWELTQTEVSFRLRTEIRVERG